MISITVVFLLVLLTLTTFNSAIFIGESEKPNEVLVLLILLALLIPFTFLNISLFKQYDDGFIITEKKIKRKIFILNYKNVDELLKIAEIKVDDELKKLIIEDTKKHKSIIIILNEKKHKINYGDKIILDEDNKPISVEKNL